MLQKQWAEVDYRRNMTIIGFRQIGRRKQVVAIGSYAEVAEHIAEAAFLVKEELHGMGIGSHLLKVLEDIARMNGYTAFMATVLAENSKMIKVFLGRYPHAKRTRTSDGEMEIEMPFL